MKTTVIHTRVSDDLKAQLDFLSKSSGVPISEIIRNAIDNHLKSESNFIFEDI